MKALLLAAGAGTRLKPLTDDRPKPMVPIAGRPAIAHELAWLCRQGIRDVAINLNHRPRVLSDYVGDGSAFGVRVSYSREEGAAYGTAGALRPLRAYFAGQPAFVVLYGDVLTDMALGPILEAHRAADADVTIVLTRVEDPTRAGIVEFGADGWIRRLVEKPRAEDVFSDWANAGIYVCGPAVLDYVAAEGSQDFAHELFPAMLRDGRRLRAWPTEATVIDFGAPERLEEASRWVTTAAEAAAPC